MRSVCCRPIFAQRHVSVSVEPGIMTPLASHPEETERSGLCVVCGSTAAGHWCTKAPMLASRQTSVVSSIHIIVPVWYTVASPLW